MNCLFSLTKTWINPRPIYIASIKNMFTHSINPIPMHITPVYFHVDSIVQELLLLPAYFPPSHSARSRKAKSQNPSSKKLPSFSGRGVNRPRRWVRACQIHFSPPPNQFPPVTRCRCLSRFLHLENWSPTKGWNDYEFRWFFLHQDESWKQSPSINNLINYISTIEMFIVIYVHKWYRIQAA